MVLGGAGLYHNLDVLIESIACRARWKFISMLSQISLGWEIEISSTARPRLTHAELSIIKSSTERGGSSHPRLFLRSRAPSLHAEPYLDYSKERSTHEVARARQDTQLSRRLTLISVHTVGNLVLIEKTYFLTIFHQNQQNLFFSFFFEKIKIREERR